MGPFDDLLPNKPGTGPFDDLLPEKPSLIAQAGSRAADIGISALKGAIGVPETAVGLADLVTGGQVGKLAEQAGFRPQQAKSILDEYYSPEQKAANQALADAKGFFPTIGAAVQNPSTILHAAIESAPSMGSGAVLGRGLLAAAPKLTPLIAGAFGEGAVTAGLNAEQARQQTPDGLLTGEQSAILAGSGLLTGAINLASGRLANELGIGDVNQMLVAGRLGPAGAEALAAGANKGIARKIGEGALLEGVTQELPQSYQEQVAQNLALGRPWDEGAAEAGAQGMLVGGLMGAGAGALQARTQPANPPPGGSTTPPPGAPNTPPPGPLTAAAGPLGQNPPGTPPNTPPAGTGLGAAGDAAPPAPPGTAGDPLAQPRARLTRLFAEQQAQAGAGRQQAQELGAQQAELFLNTDPAAPAQPFLPGFGGATVGQVIQNMMPEPVLPAGPLAAAAGTINPSQNTHTPLALNAEAAQKRADFLSNDTGIPHQVAPHPSAAGRFFAQPVPAQQQASAAAPDGGAVVATRNIDAPDGSSKSVTTLADGTVTIADYDADFNLIAETTSFDQKQADSFAQQTSASAKVQAENEKTAKTAEKAAQDAEKALQDQKAAGSTAQQDTPFAVGDAVQVALGNGKITGTRIATLSDDGQSATVAGYGQPVPLSALTHHDPQPAPATQATLFEEQAQAAHSSPTNDKQATDAQIKANNAPLGHGKIGGLAISVENDVGSVRSGTDPETGEVWSNTLQDTYGYLKGVPARAPDKEHVDVFVKQGTPDDHQGDAFIIDQNNADGSFDEPKVILGADSIEDARATYLRNYDDTAAGRIGAITQVTHDDLKAKLQDVNAFMQPQAPTGTATSEKVPNMAPIAPAAGPLSHDELSNLFDEVTNEATAEKTPTAQPETPAGSATPTYATLSGPDQAGVRLEQSDALGDSTDNLIDGEVTAAGRVASDKTKGSKIFDLYVAKKDNASDAQDAANEAFHQKDISLFDGVAAGKSGKTYDQLYPKTAAKLKAALAGTPMSAPAEIATPSAEELKAGAKAVLASPFYGVNGKVFSAAETQGGESVSAHEINPVLGDHSGGAFHDFIERDGKLWKVEPTGLKTSRLEEVTLLSSAPEGGAKVEAPDATADTSSPTAPAVDDDAPSWTGQYDQVKKGPSDHTGWRLLGKNADGNDVYEAGGMRRVVDGDYTVTEVAHKPKEGRVAEFKTAEEAAATPTGPTTPFDSVYGDVDVPKVNARIEAETQRWGYPAGQFEHKTYGNGVLAPIFDSRKRITLVPRDNGAQPQVSVDVAEGPNGKWGFGYELWKDGHTFNKPDSYYRDVLIPDGRAQFDSRDAALAAAAAKVKSLANPELAARIAASPALQASSTPNGVDYPNRKLGFQKARTDDADAYNDQVWANIAAANMQVGDSFELNGKHTTVTAITDKTLRLVTAEANGNDRKMRIANPDGVNWPQFQRDLGGQLAGENRQAKNILKPARPLIEILKRDPAVHVDENGSVYLKDGGIIDVAPTESDGASTKQELHSAEQKPGDKAAHSAQYESYRKFIEAGNDTPGLREQIRVDERLDDGEGAQLLALMNQAEAAPPAAPAQGKEVSRFSGKYGKGMSEPNAQMAANNRAKADPAHAYAIEERDDGRFDVVGREKVAPKADAKPATDGFVKLGERDDGTEIWADASGTRQKRQNGKVIGEFVSTQDIAVDMPSINARAYMTAAELAAIAPAAQATAAPTLPNGQYATVEQPLKFVSGMSRPGDFAKLFAEHRNVGIQVGEIHAPTPFQIGAAMAKSNGYLFIDSGAFPVYMSNMQAFMRALDKGFADWKGETVLTFDAILAKYDKVHAAVAKADDSGAAAERVFFVMPDIIGRQKDSLDLVSQYKGAINGYGERAILPLQVGELSLTQAYETAMISLLKDPDTDSGPAIGIPSAKEAVSNEQLTALLKKHGARIPGVHILGAFADKTLGPRLEAIRAAGYTGNVSADANRLRSLMYGQRDRADAFESLLAETAAQPGEHAQDKVDDKPAIEPLKLSDNPLQRAAQIRTHIIAQLDADALLVQQGNMAVNQFKDFKPLFQAAFEKALVGLADRITAEDFTQATNRLTLPGYVGQAAQKFIDAHYPAKVEPVVPAAPPRQQQGIERRAQNIAYKALHAMPSVIDAAFGNLQAFTVHAQTALKEWVKAELGAAVNDPARQAELRTLVADDQVTLPQEFYASLQKYAWRAARLAEKAAARNPETYKQALLEAATAAGIPIEPDAVALFVAGFDHALAGKTKSTLPPNHLVARGYEAAQAWIKTDTGRNYYEGKRGTKLENTGADLRRWFDKSSAKIKDVSADNLPGSYEVIKASASRVDAFADLAGKDATPGTTRYITDLRDTLIPFQEWLLSSGHPLDYLYGNISNRRATESDKIAGFLAGTAYPSVIKDHATKEVTYPGKDATPEQRLALLQQEAQKYLDSLRQIAAALQGATTVEQASQRFTRMMVADLDASTWKDTRLTDAGRVLKTFFRGDKYSRFEIGTYYTRDAIKNEAKPDEPGQTTKPLLTPKLDRVVRERLPDYRKGENVTPQQFKDTFGLADVGFGSYVAAKQDQDHLNYAYDALMDLSVFLKVDPTAIGLGGKLHFTIGALGHGKFAAHFQAEHRTEDGSTVRVINLTNTKGDGTVAHEWFHALDHALSTGTTTEGYGDKSFKTWVQHPAIKHVLGVLSRNYDLARDKSHIEDFLAGTSQITYGSRKGKDLKKASDKALIENAEEGIDFYAGKGTTTHYKSAANALGADYWGNPRELIARAAEAYVHDRMEGDNNYLVNPEWVAEGKITKPPYKGTPYPTGEERSRFADAFAALVQALRFTKDGVTVDMAAFDAEVANVQKEHRDGMLAMKAELPAMLIAVRTKQRAEADARAERSKVAAAAEEARLRAIYEAKLQAELDAAAALPKEPTGPLSDDELNNLFDDAESELAEAAQNEPEAKEPGETVAAPAERWTREDYQFLLGKIEAGDVILLADPVPGLTTIHDVPGTEFIGYGTLRSKTFAFEVVFSGGGEMKSTPSGQSYTDVTINKGRDAFLQMIHWDQAKAKLQAKLIVKSGPKAAPTLAATQEKTAGKLIAEAAKLGVKGIDEALKGLSQLFGGPGKLNSFPSGFDEDAYNKAKPHFAASLKAFQDAGKTLKDLFKFLIQQLGAGVKPYAIQFAKDEGLGAQLAPPAADDAVIANAPTVDNTDDKENDHDSTSDGPAPALDTALDAGPAPGPVASTDAIRGAGNDAGTDRPNDDPGVRGPGGSADGKTDAGEDLGHAGGNAGIQHPAPDGVAGNPRAVPARDFRAGVADLARTGSWLDSATRNVDIIELALAIQAEGRTATPAEQAQLARYVGFGAGEIRNKLFPVPSSYAKQKDPSRLIWPSEIYDPTWKALAERLDALPRDWQQSLLQSTQYAHYTSAPVINAIWKAVDRLGFTGGKMLEPGMGIGSFAMLMPESMHQTSRYTGIEFDGPTALIAQLLSPQQNMLHADFIRQKLPKNFFDLAIGNPPFSKTKIVSDPEYAKNNFALHDYFFAKSLDRVRPGGLQIFVTSRYTMDKAADKARLYLSARADLIGAIRLPQTAFQDNAGTSVVTDVLFLRKRLDGEARSGVDWNALGTLETKDGPVLVNQYFVEHPEMILGQSRLSGNRDDMERYISGLRGINEYTVVSYDKSAADLEAKFAAATEKLPANVYSTLSKSPDAIKGETAKVDFNPTQRREGVLYVAKDGTLMRVSEGVGKPLGDKVKLSAKDSGWLKDYVALRDLVRDAQAAQVNDGAWEKALKKLNSAYDKFRKDNGPLLDFRLQSRKSTDEDGEIVVTDTRVFKNRRLYREDYDASIVTALETISEEGAIQKAPFLLGRTIGRPVARDVKTVGDALAVSLDANGRLDLADVARRIGLSEQDTIDALGTQLYQTPQGDLQLADEYLSGDVVAKLEEARSAANIDPALERNVAALMAVQPAKLGPSQITVKLGASWVPAQYVNDFSNHIGANAVTFDPKTESWQVEGGNVRSQRTASADYGSADRSPSELLEAILNSRPIVVKYGSGAGKDLAGKTDPAATTQANEVAKRIRNEFKSWVWLDAERATDLVELYNTQANNLAGRKYDGSHLTLPGVSLRFKLFSHQLRAIWRIVQTGNTYLAHAVGAGKTIEMIAAGMEQKRLGLIQKPMYVVPNHMLEQFANEFMELYPLANIMVADDENFSAERRRAFVAAATLNAPDAVVITHSAFKLIGVKEESVAPIRDEILTDLEAELAEVAKDNGQRVRRAQLEQQIEAVKQRFDKVLGMNGKDSTISFEDIGADMLIVDEAHNFRKLDFSTSQQIKGVDPKGSQAALGLYVKTRYLEKMHPGRSMVFASGTPVTNTMGELYTVMRFFNPEMMAQLGISSFDAWSRMFGEAVTSLEPNATGKYENVERFAKFVNIPELMSRVRQFMDVLTSEHLGALVKRPDIAGGKPEMVIVDGTPELKRYMEEVLTPRLVRSRAWKPTPQEPFNRDPVLNIITDGKFAALDPRYFGATVKDGTPTKLNRMVEEIIKEYHATKDETFVDNLTSATPKTDPVKGATQIVFFNQGFGPAAKANRFDARSAMNKMLVAGGIDRAHIAWFDDADSDAKKEAVFKDMRSGKIRVLIGSAKKMGTGVNVQKRLSALHYFDPPWYPSDLEQPMGRILRMGNQHDEVRIKWYSTKGTYDETMWGMMARKQRFIDQAFAGDINLRTMDDLSAASLFEQAAAVSSGDPRAIQLAGLRQDVERLENLQAAHSNEQVNLRGELRSKQWSKEYTEKAIVTLGAAFKALGEQHVSFAKGNIGKVAYDNATAFGDALKAAYNEARMPAMLSPGAHPVEIATLPGIQLNVVAQLDQKKIPNGRVFLTARIGPVTQELLFSDKALDETDLTGVGLARAIFTKANGISSELARERAKLIEIDTAIARMQKKVGAPFPYMQDMIEKNAELLQLEDALRSDGSAPTPTTDAPGLYRVTSPEGDVADRTLSTDDINELRKHKWTIVPLNSATSEQRRSDDRLRRSNDQKPTAEPLFARAKADQANAVPHEAHAPVSDAILDRTIDRITAAFAKKFGRATTVPIEKVRQFADLPQVILDAAAAQGVKPTAPGVFYDGTVYLVQANHRDAADVEKTVFHELMGHAAVRALFNDDYEGHLNTLLQRIGGGEGLRAIAMKNKIDLSKYLDGLQADTKSTDQAKVAAIMDELLAHLAEQGPSFKQTVRWFLGTMRNFLRKYGFAKLADYNDSDLAYLLAQAHKALASGTTATASGALARFADTDKPVFYSALERGITQMPTDRKIAVQPGQAKLWIASKAKAGLFKPAEVEASGINDWLDLQQGKVPLAALLRYLRENGVQVREVMKGQDKPSLAKEIDQRVDTEIYDTAMDASNDYWFDTIQIQGEEEGIDVRDLSTPERLAMLERAMPYAARIADVKNNLGNEIRESIEAQLNDEVHGDAYDDTKYANYTLPGGTNYRELLLTLPQKEVRPDPAEVARIIAGRTQIFDAYQPRLDQLNAALTYNMDTAEHAANYAAYSNLQDERNTKAAKLFGEVPQPHTEPVKYQSGHWDDANVLAHVRFNDRTDAGGARVLFIEEIQSDWAQQGKKKGFTPDSINDTEIEALKGEGWQVDDVIIDGTKPSADPANHAFGSRKNLTGVTAPNAKTERGAWLNIARMEHDVPAAPFVGKTEAWVSLAVKRMIRFAAENGYDKVAFVNGAQSADRYKLSQHISKLTISEMDGRYDFSADNNSAISKSGLTPEDLADNIGKELADKAIATLGELRGQQATGVQMYRLLESDGHPFDDHKYQLAKASEMAYAYGDLKIVRAEVHKVAPRPVEKTFSGLDLQVGGEGMKAFYDTIVPNVVNDVLKKLGGGKLGTVNIDTATDEQRAGIDRAQRMGSLTPGYGATDQPGFAITPALRDQALAGMPLFARGDQTDTPAFKQWFGNSQVVDADGRPLVVYHGTRKDFEAFRASGRDLGIHFGPAEQASSTRFTGKTTRAGGRVMPVYLRITNPLRMMDTFRPGADSTLDITNQLVDLGLMTDQAQDDILERMADSGGNAAVARAYREIVAVIRAAGYDGVVYQNTAEGDALDHGDGTISKEALMRSHNDSWIAFDPEQIKSAIGNNGGFDPKKPNILFSRGNSINDLTEMLRSNATLGVITSSVKAAVAADPAFAHFNAYDRTLSTQYNKARKDADFRAVFEPVQQQMDDTAHYAIEAERAAPDVLVRLDGFADISKALFQGSKQHATDMAAVAKALFANIEGQQGIQQFRFTPAELEQYYQLTPHQIALYGQARLAVDTSIERLAQSTIMAIGQKAGIDVAPFKNMGMDDTAALVQQALAEHQQDAQLRAQAEANITGVAPAALPNHSKELAQRIDGILDTAAMLQERAYMPALRFGQYAVTVKNPAFPGSTPLSFRMFESQFAANAAARKLAAEFPGMSVVKSAMNPEQYKMFKGVSPETVELFAKFSGIDQEQAYQDYIALAKAARSTMARELQRQGVAGFSTDVSRVLSSFILSNARQSALNVNNQNINDALASPSLAKKGDVQREAQKLVEYMANPNEEAQKLRGFMFMYFIGGSIGSAITNLTQPLLQTLPWLTQYVGAKAGAILLTAARQAAGGTIADPLLRAGFERANADGITQPQEIHSLMADSTASVLGSSLRARALTQAWSAFFSQAETYNRRLTFLAAYAAALKLGPAALAEKGFKDAYDFAERAVNETQGLYNRANRPNWGRGPVGAVLLTFKQFSITYLEMINRMPWQQKAIALAVLTLAAGVEGWPFAENLEDLVDTLGQTMGYNTNSKKALRQAATGILGETFGMLLVHGATRLSGADLSGRIGLGRMLPGTAMFKPSDQKLDTNDIGGAFEGILTAFHDAFRKAQMGHIGGYTGALATAAPTAVKNALQGIHMGVSGQYHDSRERNVMPVNLAQAAAKFFGLQPAAVASESERVGDMYQDKAMMGVVRAAITQRWAKAIVERDPAAVRAMVAKWQAWNHDNPGHKIIITPAAVRGQVIAMTMTREQRAIKGAPKSMRAAAAADLQAQ